MTERSISSRAINVQTDYYLYGEIGEAVDYIDLIQALSEAAEGDTVVIRVNSMGGSLETTVSIITAMRNSLADVITIAEGAVYSGGSMIFFSGKMLVVEEHCEVMLHDGSGGMSGKLGELLCHAASASARMKNIYYSVYKPFFTEEEIDSVLAGVDKYLLADEVVERINAACEVETDTE